MLKVHFNFKPFLLTLAISTLLLSLFLTFNTKAQAALGINRTVNFQGKLVNNPSGTNVSNTSYTVIFTIYDNPSGGTALWTETQTVTTADGIFRASLGSVTPIPANFNFNWSDLYLGVKVNADSEMTPRVKLAAVPFAFNAERVAGLTVQDDAGNASTSGTLRVANAKTVTFAGSNGLTFNDPGGSTTITFPATGSLTLVDTATGQTLTNKIIGSTGLTFTGATTDITTGTNEAFVIAPNGSGFIGINTTTPLASFDLRNNGVLGGTIAIASVSGRTSFATLVVNNDLVAGDLFTASSSSQSRFTIKGNGQIIANAYKSCALETDSTGLFTCGTDDVGSAGGYSPFQELNAAIFPNNSTLDFFIGGQASDSAKFAVLGVADTRGSQIASISGSLTLDSTTARIQSTNNRTLNIGGNTTGSIEFTPKNVTSSFYVGANAAGNRTFLGLGTTNPQYDFHLVKSDDLVIKMQTAEGFIADLVYNDGTSDVAELEADTNFNTFEVGTVHADWDLFFKTAGTGRMFISRIGKVGIGTNVFSDEVGNGQFVVNQTNNFGTSGDIFSASAAGVTKFRITNGGNLILNGGTISNIVGAVNIADDFSVSSSVTLGDGSGTDTIEFSNGSGDILFTAGFDSCSSLVTNTGILSCGTDNTGQFSLLNGAIVANNSTLDFLLGSQSSTSAKFKITGNSPFAGTLSVASVAGRTSFAALVVDNHGVGDLFTASRSGAPRFVISNQGYVGIGTVVPNTELEVVGDIVSVGTKFVSRTSPADNSWNGVAYGNGLFVAVASTGTNNRVMTSPDGINWTTRSAPDLSWQAITYGNGLFVAVGSTSGVDNQVMTSPDGINWTIRKSSADITWQSVTYGNGLFVAVGGSGTTLMSSPDGINWTTRTSPSSQSWTAVTYGNGLFVAVAGGSPNTAVITSANGISWQLRTGANNLWSGITYGNGLFVAVSSGGSTVQTSPDGITWSSPTVPTMSNSLVGISYGDGLFVAISNGSSTMTSHNGVNWTRRSAPTGNAWNEIAFGNGMFVAVSSTGTNDRVMTSGKPTFNQIATDNIFQGGLKVFGSLSVGTTSGLAAFDVRGNSGTTSVASVSGRTSFAALVSNNDGVGDLFTASSSSQTRFTITNNGGVVMNGSLAVNGDLITADGATLTINAGGTVDIQDGLTVDSLTIDTGDITWSGSTPTITINAAETFTISNGTAADNFIYNTSTNALQLGDGTNGLTFDIDTGMTYQGSGRKVKKITLSAEYAGAVLTASGSATTNGSMTSDASPSGALSNYMNYYEWTSSQTTQQDYTVAIRVHLPEDFSAWATSTAAAQIKFNTETSINSLINKLDVMIYNTDNALSASDQATPVVFKGGNTSLSKNWKDIDILSTQLDSGAARDIDAAGEVMVIYLKMSSKDNNHVQVGNIVLSYLSAF